MVVPPSDLFDPVDPDTGFSGTVSSPHPMKYLRLWADGLLTVSHDGAYTVIVDSSEPFEQAWI
jgi:hypothetical protein